MLKTKHKKIENGNSCKTSPKRQNKIGKKVETSKQHFLYKDFIVNRLVTNSTFIYNLSPQIIITTRNNIHLSLIKHLRDLRKKYTWTTPLGMLIASVLALVTTNPKDYILSAAVWEAVFILGSIASFCWFMFVIVCTIIQARKSKTIDEVIENVLRDLTEIP